VPNEHIYESNDGGMHWRDVDAHCGLLWHRQMGALRLMVLLAIALMAVGCGGSPDPVRSQRMPSGGRTIPPPGSQILVREQWRTGGGRFLIVAESDQSGDKSEFEMSTYGEAPGFRGMSPRGGLPGAPSGGAKLVMRIERNCQGSSIHALAYGLLHDPRDTVTGLEDGALISFTKVAIPGHFDAGGVLVYAQVEGGPTDVVTRSPKGRIIGSQTYGLERFVCH
jgi:hypothetical protein